MCLVHVELPFERVASIVFTCDHCFDRCRQNNLVELYSQWKSSSTHRRYSQWVRTRQCNGTSSRIEHEWQQCRRTTTIRRLAWTSQRLFVLFSQVECWTARFVSSRTIRSRRLSRDVGVQAIEQLLEKRRNQFDYILLETTGVADPLPIAKMFWLDDELHSDLILDGRSFESMRRFDRICLVCCVRYRSNNSCRCLQWIESKKIRSMIVI
jgi:hypothetical protein